MAKKKQKILSYEYASISKRNLFVSLLAAAADIFLFFILAIIASTILRFFIFG